VTDPSQITFELEFYTCIMSVSVSFSSQEFWVPANKAAKTIKHPAPQANGLIDSWSKIAEKNAAHTGCNE
jgi:hypothetical protein